MTENYSGVVEWVSAAFYGYSLGEHESVSSMDGTGRAGPGRDEGSTERHEQQQKQHEQAAESVQEARAAASVQTAEGVAVRAGGGGGGGGGEWGRVALERGTGQRRSLSGRVHRGGWQRWVRDGAVVLRAIDRNEERRKRWCAVAVGDERCACAAQVRVECGRVVHELCECALHECVERGAREAGRGAQYVHREQGARLRAQYLHQRVTTRGLCTALTWKLASTISPATETEPTIAHIEFINWHRRVHLSLWGEQYSKWKFTWRYRA